MAGEEHTESESLVRETCIDTKLEVRVTVTKITPGRLYHRKTCTRIYQDISIIISLECLTGHSCYRVTNLNTVSEVS